jgi:hypothetical protein
LKVNIEEGTVVADTERGTKGFGSTELNDSTNESVSNEVLSYYFPLMFFI